MHISFDLPADLAQQLAASFEDLERAAKEAFVIEGYRQRKFGIATLRRALGFETRWDAEQWLSQRNVPMNYTSEDLEADRQTLDRLLGNKD